jgi:hypothetical protein
MNVSVFDNALNTESQMPLLPYDDNGFTKNIALASPMGINNPTLRKLTCLHALQFAILEQFMLRNPEYNSSNIHTITEDFIEKGSTTFDVPEEQIMANLGYFDKSKYYSLGQVLGLFEEIANETIGFDSYGVSKSRTALDEWVGFTKIIASVERKNGYFRFNVPPKIVHRIINPQVSFKASIDWSGYTNKYSPSFYELCMFFHEKGDEYTDWFSINILRNISKISCQKYGRLKSRVLSPAIKNINDSSSLDLYIELEEDCRDESAKKKIGRNPITHIRFKVKKKVGALKKRDKVMSDITLSSQKTELRSLGIASNQVDDVLNETRDENGDLVLPYLSWCIRRGHEIKKFSDNAAKDLNVFGGYFRKNVVRKCKEEWSQVELLLTNYVIQRENGDGLADVALEKRVAELRERIKVFIGQKYISCLSENAFVFFKESFVNFLKNEVPSAYENYDSGKYGSSITEMDAQGTFYLSLYLDHKLNLFSYAAYEEYLVDPDSVF